MGMKNVAVTNGCICEEPLIELLPLIDAMNIDLKGFTERFYKMVGGDLSTVMRTIERSAQSCHVEVTTLVIPGENDSEEEMDALSGWLASVDAEIPLHGRAADSQAPSRLLPCPPPPASAPVRQRRSVPERVCRFGTGWCLFRRESAAPKARFPF